MGPVVWERIAESGLFLSALDKILFTQADLSWNLGFQVLLYKVLEIWVLVRASELISWGWGPLMEQIGIAESRHSYWKHDLYTKLYLCLYIHIIYKQIMAQRSQVTCAIE